MSSIEVKCEGSDVLPISKLTYFQGDLKDLSEENYTKLRNQIVENGFKFPFFVWKHRRKNYLIDGHQRYRTLLRLEEDGYKIPDLPVCVVKAKDIEEAKQAVLAATSQYGELNKEGFKTFIKGLDAQEVFEYTTFRGFDTSSFFNKDKDGRLSLSDIFGDDKAGSVEPEKDKKSNKKEFDKNSISENEEVELLMGFKTAISRDDVSLPVRWYEEKDLISEQENVLDFGAGMDPHKYTRYDPYYDFNPKVLKERYGVVMCNYVLNVQAHVGARLAIALAVRSLIDEGGFALFAVMTHQDNGGSEAVVRSNRGFQAFLDPKIFAGELKQVFRKIEKLKNAPFVGWRCEP